MSTPTPLDTLRQWHPEFTAIRQDIHAHPEIGFTETRTAGIVAAKLTEYGIEVHTGVGGTGVVGVLRRGNGQASIGLRADMDALPIHEETGKAYSSTTPGVMHACGHDGHTTILLAAARYLSQHGEFNGTVNFIFQPAEEGLGGALAMLKDGLLERFPCNFVYGLHNSPGLPVGKFAIRRGAAMASGAFFDITVRGRGAHGALPEQGIDPVLVACHMNTALQSIVSRNVPPAETAVVSVTVIQSGDAYNVIPDTAVLRGTVRTALRSTMELVEAAMRRIAPGIAAGFGATAEVDFRLIFAPLVNDAVAFDDIVAAAGAVVGAENVNTNNGFIMASEDFSFVMEKAPGAYINLGNVAPGEAGATGVQVHNPGYDFNDAAIPLGAAMFCELTQRKLPRGVA